LQKGQQSAERKENRTLQTLQRLVRLFVAELISQSKCRRLLADLPSQEMEGSPDWQGNFLPQLEEQTVQKRKVWQPRFSFLFQACHSDEISHPPKGYTPFSNSQKFLYLGSREALPHLLCGLVATSKNLSGNYGNLAAKTPSHRLYTF
jgi:hypothetical protein